MEEKIKQILEENFKNNNFTLINESAQHAGHEGVLPTGETHFRLIVISEIFKGKTLVQRHQYIYKILDSIFKAGLHSLQMELYTPGEAPSH